MRDVSRRYQLRQFSPEETSAQVLLNTFREWGGAGTPNIAILDWNDLPTTHEFVLLEEFFSGQGIPTLICTQEQLELRERKTTLWLLPDRTGLQACHHQ